MGLLFISSLIALASAELGILSHVPITRWYEDDIQAGTIQEITEFENALLQFYSYGRPGSGNTIESVVVEYSGINTLNENSFLSPPSENIIEVTSTSISLDFSSSINEVNVTPLSVPADTDFTWIIRTTDTRGDVSSSTITLRVLNDESAPTYSNEVVEPAHLSEYSPNQNYTFNITWSDDVALNQVILEFSGTNYTSSNLSENGNVYGRVFTDLAAGIYSYRWYATDNPGNQNNTEELTYTINQANDDVNLTINGLLNQDVPITYGTEITATATSVSRMHQLFRGGEPLPGGSETITLGGGTYTYTANSTGNQNYSASAGRTHTLTVERAAAEVNLLLEGTDGDLTIEETAVVNIEGEIVTELIASSSELELYENGTLISSGQRQFNISGDYNITVIYPQNQNYTATQESHNIIVQAAQWPAIEFVSPTPANNTYLSQNYIDVSVTAGDLYLDSLAIYLYNASGSLVGSSTSSTSPLSATFTALADGTYIINATANDTVNHVSSTGSRTIILDTTAPSYSNLSESPADPAAFSSAGQDFFFNITWADNIYLDSDTVTLVFNEVAYTNVSENNENGNVFGMYFTNLTAGTYTYRWQADDTAGNRADTGELTYTINSPSSPSSDSGGSGGGGGSSGGGGTNRNAGCADGYEEVDGECVAIEECNPNWECGSWGSCSNGEQTRDCSDINSCGSEGGLPDESRACSEGSDVSGSRGGLRTEGMETPVEPLPEEVVEADAGGNILTGAYVGAANFMTGNKGKSSLFGLLTLLSGLGIWKRKALKNLAEGVLARVKRKRKEKFSFP